MLINHLLKPFSVSSVAGVLAVATLSFSFAASANAADFDYALKRGGNDASRAATKLLKKGRAADAAPIFRGIINKGGRKALLKIAHTNLCAAESMLGNQDVAVKACNTAIELDSGYWEAWLNRGHAKQLLGDKTGAAEDYAKAQNIAPKEDVVIAAVNALSGSTLAAK